MPLLAFASSASLALSLAACGGAQSAAPGGDDGGPAAADAAVDAPPASAGIGANGGTVSHLLFAVVGDTRPPDTDDVAGYPTAIITSIYKDVQALNPRPPFVVSTGDYQFSSSYSGSTASQQMDIYMHARALYSGLWFPALGNHECTGATASNCGPGNSDGNTPQFNAFLSQMLGPIHKTKPYYSINVDATDGSWTSKFVFTAANAWDSGQQSWLQQTLAQKTTYTFVVRHEPSGASAPGVQPIDTLLGQSPYTLLIVGHSHTYEHSSYEPKTALIGNGGAPLSSSAKDYGFGVFSQRADGAIVGDEIDYQTGQADPSFHFVVKPDGTLTN